MMPLTTCTSRNGLRRVLLIACLGAVMTILIVHGVMAQDGDAGDTVEQNNRCLDCHGRPHIAELTPKERLSMVGTLVRPDGADVIGVDTSFVLRGDEPETRPGLYVTGDTLAGTLHEGLSCVECHEDAQRLPHAPKLNVQVCASACHTDAYTRYQEGAHFAAANGDHGDQASRASEGPLGPGCATCHNVGHLSRADADEPSTHPLRMVEICSQCHLAQTGTTSNGDSHAARVEQYADSIHGHLALESGLIFAATCETCHDNHRVLPASDPRSTVYRANIPETCGQCHLGIARTFATSIHGQLFAEGDERAPSCVDCHSAHGITDTRETAFLLDVIEECGGCHDTPEMAQGARMTFYESYRRSYHGQVTTLGSTRAARCSDCHGAHDILPLDDPASRVSAGNIVGACQTCHPNANASFVKYAPHADYRDRERHPVLFGIWIYFIIIMSAAFGFFGFHTIMWIVRSTIERIRHGPRKRFAHTRTSIRRFRLINRFNHALTALSFFGLTTTGIPLLFSDRPWARPLVDVFGGVVAAGVWHRVFAVVLIINVICFFSWLAHSALTRKTTLRKWFFGPDSLMPSKKDFRDCTGMFRWFFRGGKKPAFDRWTYWEKFDFWCEIGGTAIIGGSGLLLWFPTFFSRILPGGAFNAATVVHGFEALLAIGFIFTIHFFNANLRYEKFPMDDVMFTGCLPEEELAEERPLEYERLKATGRLEQLRVDSAPRGARIASRIFGIALMAFGLALITLIILAGLGVF